MVTNVVDNTGNCSEAQAKRIGLLHHRGTATWETTLALPQVTDHIKKQWLGAEISGFPLNPSDRETRHGIPLRAHTDLGEALLEGSLSRVHQWTAEELLANECSMDYVITCRFHGIVFAHLMNKPVIAMSPHPQMDALMNAFGLSDYCLDIRTFDCARLADTFCRLVDNREVVKARIAENVARYRAELSNQFDALFPRQAA